MLGDEEDCRRGRRGERCWEMSARRDDMKGRLWRARIMSDRMNGRIRKIEEHFDLIVIRTKTR